MPSFLLIKSVDAEQIAVVGTKHTSEVKGAFRHGMTPINLVGKEKETVWIVSDTVKVGDYLVGEAVIPQAVFESLVKKDDPRPEPKAKSKKEAKSEE